MIDHRRKAGLGVIPFHVIPSGDLFHTRIVMMPTSDFVHLLHLLSDSRGRYHESMATDDSVSVPHSWAELLAQWPDFPDIIHRWLRVIAYLIIGTHLQEGDQLGELIVAFMTSSRMDINDLMTLSHGDSHYGSQYFLRVLFERTVTLKYLVLNPDKVEDFIDYDAVDWDQILKGISYLTGKTLSESALTNISTRAKSARQKNKQNACSVCGYQPTSWSRLSTKNMAENVGMSHLYLNCYIFPSKLMHPTLWGTRERINPNNPMYNTLKSLHELMVELILIHRRYFANKYRVTPMGAAAIREFLKVWTISETSFGGLLTLRTKREKGKEIVSYYG